MDLHLTSRELELLPLIVEGKSNKEISKTLHISIHTTKAHLESIFEKLEVKNRVQVAIKAVSLKLVDISHIN